MYTSQIGRQATVHQTGMMPQHMQSQFGGYTHQTSVMPQPPQRKIFIEFLLSRPTIDLPPIEHLHAVSSLEYQQQVDMHSQQQQDLVLLAKKRTIDGVVRITIDHAPLVAEKLILRFRGGRVGAHETLLKLLLWQPSSPEEFQMGLQIGRHDFPFALDIPSNLHTSNEAVKIPVIPPGPCGSVSDHFRSYELTATVHSLSQNMMVEDTASRPMSVRRCYPVHWFRPFPGDPPAVQRCVGTTAPNGELGFRAVIPKIWNLRDKVDIPIELQLDDGADSVTKITLVECVLMQRLRHREAPVNGSQPNTSAIPNTVTGTVGQPLRCKPPVLAAGSRTLFLNIEIPFSAMQTDAELDPFLLEHVFNVTVHVSKMMTTKKCNFFLPLKVCMPGDDDDRLLATLPPPVGWFLRPQQSNPQRRSSVAMTVSSHGSSSKDKPKPKLDDLASLMSMGVSPSPASSSPSSKRSQSNRPENAFAGGGGRRKSTSSQGSGGSGPRHTTQIHQITNGMNDMMLGGGGSPMTPNTPGMLQYSNSMRSSGGVSMASRANSQGDQWRNQQQPRYSNASSGSGGNGPNMYSNGPVSPMSNGSGPGGWGIDPIQPTGQQPYVPYNGARPSPQSNPSPTFYPQQQQLNHSPSLRSVPTPTTAYSSYPTPPQQSQNPGYAASIASSISYQQPQPVPPSTFAQPPPQQSYPGQSMPPPPSGPLPPTPPAPLPSVPETVESLGGGSTNGDAPAPSTTGGSHVFRVQYAFTPTLDDEIALDVGDLIEVLEVFDDGWARGRTLKSEGAGYFPVRCLTLPTTTATPVNPSPAPTPVQDEKSVERAKFEEAHGGIHAARRVANVETLVAGKKNARAIALDVNDDTALTNEVAKYDVVISLIPYTHHARVIKAAIQHKKHVVTTSYISDAMKEYDESAKAAGVTIMNEIGVDPGIDHLYAVKIIDEVHKEKGKVPTPPPSSKDLTSSLPKKVISFKSFCGGLPAPECSNNPLGYKFSWSSRGVLLALRNNAKYIDNGKVVEIPGPELMSSAKEIPIYPAFAFEGYPNRDSSPYTERYHIPEAQTVIRGTLRYKGFPEFIKALVKLGFLSDEQQSYLAPTAAPLAWRSVLSKVLGASPSDNLEQLVLAKIGLNAESGERIVLGMKWLGLFSETAVQNRGTLLDTLCSTLEEKMQYGPGERDMVMLQHRFDIELANGKKQVRTSTGLWFGLPGGDSAMATTVGVPCGIATQLILDGVLTRRGVIAPMDMEIVNPLLEALEKEGISMVDEIIA
ncbi:hypothetical protein HDU97_000169 [Phlyctochytrium planicorne]|nr:hypothetical protein HDU97_000169 [Phlyctochytrium planicorne]